MHVHDVGAERAQRPAGPRGQLDVRERAARAAADVVHRDGGLGGRGAAAGGASGPASETTRTSSPRACWALASSAIRRSTAPPNAKPTGSAAGPTCAILLGGIRSLLAVGAG
ncbi:hypothetical protein BJF78_19625 [Pseudonocardia sp. CNS-139]|nr:hypothetical protein BJF78_19625 [Pseudonocardia sp. CNS-139]